MSEIDPLLLSAYHRAIQDYAEPLQAFARRMLTEEPEYAEDVTQDAFLALYRHLHQVPEQAWRPWLYRVTRNLCLDRIRRWKHRPRAFRELADEEDRDPVAPDHYSLPPDQKVEAAEVQRDLEAAIADLPDKFREVFLLCEREGMSYEQVSSVLDIPLKTVSTRLYRARQRLLKALSKYLEEE
ncbi:MAG: RNA polymerase sigma factor [Planctomycetota bacterium]